MIAAGVLLSLAALLGLAYRVALKQLQGVVESALGPRASVGAVHLDGHALELRDVRVSAERRGAGAWPADDELRAERIVVVPELRSLLGDTWRVRRILIDHAYVSALRTRDGHLRVLPGLLEATSAAPAASPAAASAPGKRAMPPVHVGRVELRNAEVEFFDASIRQPAHRMRLAALTADLGPLALPALDKPVGITLQAVFKGPQRDGGINIKGTVTPATRDASVEAQVKGVDLIALQPYLLRVNEGGVKRGTLDLSLHGTVTRNQLKAPGVVTLANLELGQAGGAFGTFAGVPRQAVIAAMSRDGKLAVKFTLEGRLDDPAFSINENFATRVAGGLAQGLGVSLGGVVQGVGQVIKGLFGK